MIRIIPSVNINQLNRTGFWSRELIRIESRYIMIVGQNTLMSEIVDITRMFDCP